MQHLIHLNAVYLEISRKEGWMFYHCMTNFPMFKTLRIIMEMGSPEVQVAP